MLTPNVQFVLCLLFFEHRIFYPFIGVFTSGKDQGSLGRHKSCSGLETKCSVVCYEWDTAVHARGREHFSNTCRIFQDKICLYPEINIRHTSLIIVVASWLCIHLQMEWFRLKHWPETLRGVLGQDTLLSQCFSPPGCINEYQQSYH